MVVRKRWGVMAAVVVAVVSLKLFVFPTAEIHYRLAAHFENSQGKAVVAQGVWAVYYAASPRLLPDPDPIEARYSGDAIRIDNGGHTLWILLAPGQNCPWRKMDMSKYGTGPAGIIFQSFGVDEALSWTRKVRSLPVPGLKAEIDICDLPQIVSIDDANDPMSARPVLFDPDGRASCCDLIFKGATIEILKTSEKITETDVKQRFPWVPDSSPRGVYSHFYWPKGQDIPKGFHLMDTSLSIREL